DQQLAALANLDALLGEQGEEIFLSREYREHDGADLRGVCENGRNDYHAAGVPATRSAAAFRGGTSTRGGGCYAARRVRWPAGCRRPGTVESSDLVSVLDLVVVGGGITGLGVARLAARSGLSVALFERGDLGSGASSATSHMLHGGLRYLEHG